MSDIGANTTDNALYDYEDYYNGATHNFSPCNDPKLRDFGMVFLPTLYSLVFILGFAGNGLVVCVLLIHRKQTNLTDICLFNLALADLLFVLTLPFYARYSAIIEWTFGDFMCRFTSTCHSTAFISSVLFMVFMTLDRYVAIVHAHTVVFYRTSRAGITLSVCIWLLSLGISLPTFVFTKVTNETACSYVPDNKAWEFYNIITTNMLGFVIPSLAMMVCYSRIISRLVNMKGTKKHHIVRLIVFIVVAYILFWAPYNISLFLEFLYSRGQLPNNCILNANIRLSIIVTEAFAYTHCCLNPIIYAFVGQRFMKRAVQLLSKWVPGIHLHFTRDLSDSTYRKSSVMSRSSDGTSTVIM